MDQEEGYDAAEYWSTRLDDEFSLRGTGHLSYSREYNAWLYRAKSRALTRALAGVPAQVAAFDVGSGVGWVVDQLRRRGHPVDGCDISPNAVERLSRQFPGSTFYALAIGADPVPRPAGSYGLVTTLDVCYHITDDGLWLSALTEMARLLTLGGQLVVTDRLGADVVTPAPHVRFRSRDMWSTAARQVGLEPDGEGVLYRWLSLDRPKTPLSRLPDRVHGAVAYGLDRITWREPHLRWARFRRSR